MIKVNLKKETYRDEHAHPLQGKYGVICNGSVHDGYPVMIVDSSKEVVDGCYSNIPSDCLIHLSKDVRCYDRLRVFEDFLYMNFRAEVSAFHMYDYKKVVLTQEEITRSLMNVLYFLEPELQTRSLVGIIESGIENDPNYYRGSYVLNDEEEYTILKLKTKYKFFKGRRSFSEIGWNDKSSALIAEGTLDLERYKKALKMNRLKHYILTRTNQILENDEDTSIEEYKQLENELKEWN